MSATYDTLEDYNAGVVAAREAYRADEAVRAGRCGTCETNNRDGAHRECWTCRHGAEWAAARMRLRRAPGGAV